MYECELLCGVHLYSVVSGKDSWGYNRNIIEYFSCTNNNDWIITEGMIKNWLKT